MRPNFPSQIAQRLAAPFHGYWRVLRIFASCEPGVGSSWCSPSGPRLSCAASRGEAADFFAVACVIPPIGLVTIALSRFGRDRRHFVTCNRLFRIAVRLGGWRLPTQLYVGKRPISKWMGESYTEVYGVCLSRPMCAGPQPEGRKSMVGRERRHLHVSARGPRWRDPSRR
jgi:hypothetical protein